MKPSKITIIIISVAVIAMTNSVIPAYALRQVRGVERAAEDDFPPTPKQMYTSEEGYSYILELYEDEDRYIICSLDEDELPVGSLIVTKEQRGDGYIRIRFSAGVAEQHRRRGIYTKMAEMLKTRIEENSLILDGYGYIDNPETFDYIYNIFPRARRETIVQIWWIRCLNWLRVIDREEAAGQITFLRRNAIGRAIRRGDTPTQEIGKALRQTVLGKGRIAVGFSENMRLENTQENYIIIFRSDRPVGVPVAVKPARGGTGTSA